MEVRVDLGLSFGVSVVNECPLVLEGSVANGTVVVGVTVVFLVGAGVGGEVVDT